MSNINSLIIFVNKSRTDEVSKNIFERSLFLCKLYVILFVITQYVYHLLYDFGKKADALSLRWRKRYISIETHH